MSWIKRILISKIAIFLFFILLSVKVFDLALGLFERSKYEIFKQSNDKNLMTSRTLQLREFSPNINKYLKPSNDYISGTQNLLQKDFLLRTDQDGFIVGPKDFNRSNSEVSIIFFGGSTTECIYVEEDKRFPYLVSENLGVRALNGGLSGNHSMHSLLSMIGKGIPYMPKHIVLMHAINDLVLLSKTLSYWNGPTSRALVQSDYRANSISFAYETMRHLKNFLIPNLWWRIRHVFQGFIEQPVRDEWAAYRNVKIDYKEIENSLTIQFTASLKSFIRVSRSWGIEPILMTQFNRIKNDDVFIRLTYEKTQQPISYNDFVALYKKANDVVRKVAKEEDVYLIDLDKFIPSTQEYMYDLVHLNTKGSELVARKITTSLRGQYPLIYR